MIQETVRKNIEDKLNDNTQGKKFIVGKYLEDDKTGDAFVYRVKTGYTLIEKNFIPCMVAFTGSYEAIPNQINGYIDITVDMLISAEDEASINADLNVLDELKPKIIGVIETITDNTTVFEAVWNLEPFTPSGVTLINGNYYTKVATVISIDFSDSNTFGNAYKYSLTYNSVEKFITPYGGSNDRENEENYPHRLDDLEAKGGNDESRWRSTIQVYADTFVQELIDDIASNTYDMGKVWTFKQYKRNKTTGEFAVINTFPIQITSLSQPILLGEKQYLTMNFIKSDRTE